MKKSKINRSVFIMNFIVLTVLSQGVFALATETNISKKPANETTTLLPATSSPPISTTIHSTARKLTQSLTKTATAAKSSASLLTSRPTAEVTTNSTQTSITTTPLASEATSSSQASIVSTKNANAALSAATADFAVDPIRLASNNSVAVETNSTSALTATREDSVVSTASPLKAAEAKSVDALPIKSIKPWTKSISEATTPPPSLPAASTREAILPTTNNTDIENRAEWIAVCKAIGYFNKAPNPEIVFAKHVLLFEAKGAVVSHRCESLEQQQASSLTSTYPPIAAPTTPTPFPAETTATPPITFGSFKSRQQAAWTLICNAAAKIESANNINLLNTTWAFQDSNDFEGRLVWNKCQLPTRQLTNTTITPSNTTIASTTTASSSTSSTISTFVSTVPTTAPTKNIAFSQRYRKLFVQETSQLARKLEALLRSEDSQSGLVADHTQDQSVGLLINDLCLLLHPESCNSSITHSKISAASELSSIVTSTTAATLTPTPSSEHKIPLTPVEIHKASLQQLQDKNSIIQAQLLNNLESQKELIDRLHRELQGEKSLKNQQLQYQQPQQEQNFALPSLQPFLSQSLQYNIPTAQTTTPAISTISASTTENLLSLNEQLRQTSTAPDQPLSPYSIQTSEKEWEVHEPQPQSSQLNQQGQQPFPLQPQQFNQQPVQQQQALLAQFPEAHLSVQQPEGQQLNQQHELRISQSPLQLRHEQQLHQYKSLLGNQQQLALSARPTERQLQPDQHLEPFSQQRILQSLQRRQQQLQSELQQQPLNPLLTRQQQQQQPLPFQNLVPLQEQQKLSSQWSEQQQLEYWLRPSINKQQQLAEGSTSSSQSLINLQYSPQNFPSQEPIRDQLQYEQRHISSLPYQQNAHHPLQSPQALLPVEQSLPTGTQLKYQGYHPNPLQSEFSQPSFGSQQNLGFPQQSQQNPLNRPLLQQSSSPSLQAQPLLHSSKQFQSTKRPALFDQFPLLQLRPIERPKQGQNSLRKYLSLPTGSDSSPLPISAGRKITINDKEYPPPFISSGVAGSFINSEKACANINSLIVNPHTRFGSEVVKGIVIVHTSYIFGGPNRSKIPITQITCSCSRIESSKCNFALASKFNTPGEKLAFSGSYDSRDTVTAPSVACFPRLKQYIVSAGADPSSGQGGHFDQILCYGS